MSGIKSSVFYPSVTSLPKQRDGQSEKALPKGKLNDFDKLLNRQVELNSTGNQLKFSNHAMERLRERNIELNPERIEKLVNAVQNAEAKGVVDTLVLMDDAAMIVSVENKTVVTAMGRDALDGNVFTNIDGAVVV